MGASPESPDATRPANVPQTGEATQPGQANQPSPQKGPKHVPKKDVHQVVFVAYPKLLFIWPLILAGLALYPLGRPPEPTAPATFEVVVDSAAQTADVARVEDDGTRVTATQPAKTTSDRLETLGWIYIWIAVVVLLTLGINIDRNQAAFWVIFVALIWVLGVWLRDSKGFTLFGDIYRWFAGLDVQYNRDLGLALSVLMLVPYLLMIGWACINDRWRITHNEFEHYSFGKMDDSVGRGAKTIRTSFPDVFELLLGLAGTLIVYNATGTRELRRIRHVMFLPFVRKRLNKILERTAITTAEMEEEEEEDDL